MPVMSIMSAEDALHYEAINATDEDVQQRIIAYCEDNKLRSVLYHMALSNPCLALSVQHYLYGINYRMKSQLASNKGLHEEIQLKIIDEDLKTYDTWSANNIDALACKPSLSGAAQLILAQTGSHSICIRLAENPSLTIDTAQTILCTCADSSLTCGMVRKHPVYPLLEIAADVKLAAFIREHS